MQSLSNGAFRFNAHALNRAAVGRTRASRCTPLYEHRSNHGVHRQIWRRHVVSQDSLGTFRVDEIAEPVTLYVQLGGAEAIEAVVECFYGKVYSDERVKKWFDGISPEKQALKMTTFLTASLQGLPYKRNMSAAHAKLVKNGMADFDFDVIEELMGAAMKECGVDDELASEVVAVVESTREAVLGRVH